MNRMWLQPPRAAASPQTKLFNPAKTTLLKQASLLHIPKSEMLNTFRAITAALKPQGIWYMSFKQGNGQRWDDRGRFFNDYSVQTLTRLLNKIDRIEILDIYEKTAAGAYGDECWLNVFLKPMK